MISLRKVCRTAWKIHSSERYAKVQQLWEAEACKTPSRYEIINYLLGRNKSRTTRYLEIGVRNPQANFDKIRASEKYGVDPGIEFEDNPVNFKMTSDAFFAQLSAGECLPPEIRFDVIFIDGLHTADQVERDIRNSLRYLADTGFVVAHDCNPPTEYHAREDRLFQLSPALKSWYGTTWKAFYKCRLDPLLSCCCIDADCGVGVISKQKYFSHLEKNMNPFFEFAVLEQQRQSMLNLMSFEEFCQVVEEKD